MGEDKETDRLPARESGSRYTDKQTGSSETLRSGSRYVDKQVSRSDEQPRKQKKKPGYKSAGGIRGFFQHMDPLKIAFLGLGTVVILAYVVVAVYYGRHFYPDTQIFGIDCSKYTLDMAKEEIRDKIGTYTLTVEERNDKSDVITADQIHLFYVDDQGVDQLLKKQYSFIWPVKLLMKRTDSSEIHTDYDREGMDQILHQMNCFLPGNIIPPRDAYKGDTEYGYEVVPEEMGTTLDYEKTKDVIMDALDAGTTTVSLEENECYLSPEIYQDDEALNKDVNELNSLLKANITIDFSDRQEYVNPTKIKEWIFTDKDGYYYIDENYIWDYVKELAAKYDTFGGYRTFYTSLGNAVELYGGDYGWAIDQDATAQMLTDDVLAGKVETIEPIYTYEGMCRDENDIGGTYVEVSIANQEMWCYENGYLMVDTPVVTGNMSDGHGTPSGGVWAIDAKMRNYTLKGEGYAAPVDYWMPFNEDVGIHDLSSRAYFGGDIYMYAGSHGCVNTPYDAAQQIYSIVSIGTPVVVY